MMTSCLLEIHSHKDGMHSDSTHLIHICSANKAHNPLSTSPEAPQNKASSADNSPRDPSEGQDIQSQWRSTPAHPLDLPASLTLSPFRPEILFQPETLSENPSLATAGLFCVQAVPPSSECPCAQGQLVRSLTSVTSKRVVTCICDLTYAALVFPPLCADESRTRLLEGRAIRECCQRGRGC